LRLLAGEECPFTFTAKMRSNSASVTALTGLLKHDASVVHQNVELAEMGNRFIKKPENIGTFPTSA